MPHASSFALTILAAALLAGCGEQPASTAAPQEKSGQPARSVKTDGGDGHGGAMTALGTSPAGPFTVAARRDAGAIAAGGDVPIDATVTGPAKPTAVRFWIGSADARGSIKAKADVEDAARPDVWHTHTEAPATMPADAKLYVEVEAGGAKHVAGFDLQR